MGYSEYYQDKVATQRPVMWGFQASGAAPFVAGHPIEKPETIATAIRIGKPASWDLAVAARDDSGGLIDAVTDAQILDAYRLLASSEGFFVEPSSAASVAGLLQQADRGLIDAGSTIVCTVTGNGLKDTQWALESAKDPVVVPVDVKAAAAAIGLV
jgi:threonine synthase